MVNVKAYIQFLQWINDTINYNEAVITMYYAIWRKHDGESEREDVQVHIK